MTNFLELKIWTKPSVEDSKQGQEQTQTLLMMTIIVRELSLITTVNDASLKR